VVIDCGITSVQSMRKFTSKISIVFCSSLSWKRKNSSVRWCWFWIMSRYCFMDNSSAWWCWSNDCCYAHVSKENSSRFNLFLSLGIIPSLLLNVI
jgi:hypothetical protein